VKISIPPIVSGLLFILGSAATAQVGHDPARSPYTDLEQAQELTLLVGDFHAHRDPANVGPQSGLLVGAHYEYRPVGPLELIGELTRMSSDRRVIDPFKAGAARELGTSSRPLYSGDLDLGLGLTGAKSWHHIVPEVSGGVGFISDLRQQPDSGGFKFGTRFALNYGVGIRVVPGGNWQIRADIKNRLYTLGYPEAFYVAPAGGTAVVPTTQSKSFWLNNPSYTLGLSHLF
jgi:hypothetical protein